MKFEPSEPPQRAVASPAASVVIPTRNRKEMLQQTIRSALSQLVPVEIIVMDDGSTDGTPEMVRQEFPQVRCCEIGKGKGPCFQRNRGIEFASTEFVFPVDDDSVFSSPNVVEQTIAEFNHPRVAAVGIPFLNPGLDLKEQQRAPQPTLISVEHAFVGAAHAVRRSLFLKSGGYREHFFYMGEEGDLCLRLLNAGFVVRMGNSDPIHHFESPVRNLSLANFCGRRNDVLFAWHNVPMRYLLIHLMATTFNGIRTGITSRSLTRMLIGTLHGYMACVRHWRERKPVSAKIYRLNRMLKKNGPLLLDSIEPKLPSLDSQFTKNT